MLTNIPLRLAVPFCRLAASEVRNFCKSALLDVLDEPLDEPSAVNRFWKSVDNEVSLDDEVVLASVDVLSESELDDEPDANDCARFSIAVANPPP